MRILVTGSLGVLGRPLVRELRSRGHTVWGCDRSHSGEESFIRADVSEYRQLAEAFELAQPQVVYHLAAEFGRHNGEGWYENLWKTGTIGTRNVLELCKGRDVLHDAHLIFASSSEIYGDVDDFSEDTFPPMQPNEYALSKWANEVQIANFQKRHGLKATRLRFFNAYGPGEAYHPYRSVVALFCHKALNEEPLPVYEGYYRTFMHVRDFTYTLANVCTAHLNHEVYNIGGEDYRSVEELARLIIDEIGYGKIDLIPEDKHNVRSKRPNIERAKQDLGHRLSIPLEQGVPETIQWMRREARVEEPTSPD